jgi:hypothetical protein
MLVPAGINAARVGYEWAGSRVLELPGVRGVRLPARLYDSFAPIGRYIREHTSEGEPVYTGLLRHDAIVINNTMLYAIVGRPACCGFTELHPGVADRPDAQQRIIRMIEARRVRAIVLWAFGWSNEVMQATLERNRTAVPDAGATLLDRYIAERFQLVESHGEYHVFWRRGEPIPD